MRLATTILVSVALVCPAWAGDPILYRRIRFGNMLTAGRMSACSVRFGTGFHDPNALPRRDDDIGGEIVFSRRDGRLSAGMTMQAFGDYTTKFTGIGQIADVTLAGGGEVLQLKPEISGAEPTRDALASGQVPGLLTMLDGASTLGFTLSEPVRRFAFPFSLTDEGLGADGGLVAAGRSIFDDCMAALMRAP